MRVTIYRRHGHWLMSSPFRAQADKGVVNRLLDQLESGRISDVLGFSEISQRELSLKEFGLAPPRVKLEVEADQTTYIHLGALAPLGGSVFARLNHDERVLVVPAGIMEALPTSVEGFRCKRLFHESADNLNSLEIRAPERPFIKLVKGETGWSLTQPVAAAAAGERVEQLLKGLCEARISRFVWPTTSNVMDVAESDASFNTRLGVYGLSDGGTQVQMLFANNNEPAKLVFGGPMKEHEGLTYVLAHDNSVIGAVSNSVALLVHLRPDDLREMRLFPRDNAKFDRIKVSIDQESYSLAHTDDHWLFQTPVTSLAEQRAMDESVQKLGRIQAEKIADKLDDAEQYSGRAYSPLSRVEVAAGNTSWRFSVFPVDPEKHLLRIVFDQDPSHYYVATSNLPSALVTRMGILSLCDKTLLSLAPESVRRIVTKRGRAAPESIERSTAEASWRVGEGTPGAVLVESVTGLLKMLERLSAERVEKLGATLSDVETYGLRDPWLTLSVDVDAVDAVRKTLLVGKETWGGKRYAMVRGLDTLFVLPTAALETLSSAIVEKK